MLSGLQLSWSIHVLWDVTILAGHLRAIQA
jgi:hypothetical protein